MYHKAFKFSYSIMLFFLFISLCVNFFIISADSLPLPLLPPTEIIPLMATDGYWYARTYGSLSHARNNNSPAFGFAGYSCIDKGLGLWMFVEKQKNIHSRFVIAPSFAYSYLNHTFFDFIDSNIRIGIANSYVSDMSLFMHFAHAYGMFNWLDIGMFATLYTASKKNESVIGFYVKADHMINYLSLQIGVDLGIGNYWPLVKRSAYVLVEYDGAAYDMIFAPVIQWWYQWHTVNNMHANSYAMSCGINGCWEY